MARHKAGQLLKGQYGGVELLLTRSVKGLGKQGEVVEVKVGYARNYLLPQGLATRATPHNLRMIEKNRAKMAAIELERKEAVEKLARELGKHSVSIEATANNDGHLYGSVGAEEICAVLKRDKMPIEPSMVRLEGPIKELGLYSVKLQLSEDCDAELKVWVVPTSSES